MSIDSTGAVKTRMIGPGGQIMAPKPQVLMAMDIKRGQKIQIPQGESIYVFVPMTFGAKQELTGFNKKSPFTVETDARPPEGVPLPRTMGSWVRIQAKYGAKVGAKDVVYLKSKAVTPRPNPAGTSIPFTLTVGPMRYYIMGAGA